MERSCRNNGQFVLGSLWIDNHATMLSIDAAPLRAYVAAALLRSYGQCLCMEEFRAEIGVLRSRWRAMTTTGWMVYGRISNKKKRAITRIKWMVDGKTSNRTKKASHSSRKKEVIVHTRSRRAMKST